MVIFLTTIFGLREMILFVSETKSGELLFPGEKMVGEFKNDKPWIVSIFGNDGEIVKRISYGMEYK